MIKYRIHFEHLDGTPDHFDVEGQSIEDIQFLAVDGLITRNASVDDAWSEELP